MESRPRRCRIGQKAKTVLIRYLIGRRTMDEGLISMIHRKQSTLRSTVGEKYRYIILYIVHCRLLEALQSTSLPASTTHPGVPSLDVFVVFRAGMAT